MRSLMIPSIHAVAEVSSIEFEIGVKATGAVVAVVVEAATVFRFLSVGGNKGKPEKPQTAGGGGLVVERLSMQVMFEVVVHKKAGPPDVTAVKFAEGIMVVFIFIVE